MKFTQTVPELDPNFSIIHSRNEYIFTIIYFTFCKKMYNYDN